MLYKLFMQESPCPVYACENKSTDVSVWLIFCYIKTKNIFCMIL